MFGPAHCNGRDEGAIDSYHDRRSAHSFAVNPLGVKIDTYHFNDSDKDDRWDAVWDVAVTRDDQGWRRSFAFLCPSYDSARTQTARWGSPWRERWPA